ncbi:MAG: response regulator [Rectinema subterraneum]|uniref:response regulator n=1 Tax=Rectinema subterraneum TaxID=2653714 RepID=UPI003C7D2AB6
MVEVLLVEDDPFTREMMMTTLHSMGYHAAMASNGQQAIEFLQNEKAEVILMDVAMPVMNGIEATRQIKKEGIDSIVIMLTAFGDEKAMEEAAEAGADDYLTKPVEMHALKARIELAKKARTFHVARSKLLIENTITRKDCRANRFPLKEESSASPIRWMQCSPSDHTRQKCLRKR